MTGREGPTNERIFTLLHAVLDEMKGHQGPPAAAREATGEAGEDASLGRMAFPVEEVGGDVKARTIGSLKAQPGAPSPS